MEQVCSANKLRQIGARSLLLRAMKGCRFLQALQWCSRVRLAGVKQLSEARLAPGGLSNILIVIIINSQTYRSITCSRSIQCKHLALLGSTVLNCQKHSSHQQRYLLTMEVSALLHQAKDWLLTPKGASITALVVLSVAAIKLYFRGGMCKVNRDLTGKVIVITGANAGIGKETLRELAKQKCTIIFGARDEAKSERVIKDINDGNARAGIKGAKIIFYRLDLAELDSVRDFAQKVNDSCDNIDVLLNNAGLTRFQNDRQMTKSGFEYTMGVNHFGHFLLTSLLWSKIVKSQSFRVINVSSLGHEQIPKKFGFDLEDIDFANKYDKYQAYCRSKVANILFTKELQRRIDTKGLNGYSVSLHPGVVKTQIMRGLELWKYILIKYVFAFAWLFMCKTEWEGAQTNLYTVLAPDNQLDKGAYYSDCKVKKSTDFTYDADNQAKMWRISEERLALKFDI